MITQNSEVFNPPYRSFSIYMYNEERYVGVIVYIGFSVLCDHPYVPCFLTFCRSGIPTSCYIFDYLSHVCLIGLTCVVYRGTTFISNGGEFSGFGLSLHSTKVS